MDTMIKKTYELEYEGKISHEQGYRLRQLVDEGVNIENGLKIYVSGAKDCIKLAAMLRDGASLEEIYGWVDEFKET